jgi:ribokinase
MAHILIISSANMDFVMPMASLPARGQTVIESGAYRYIPGGKGANSAVAVARLGGDCTFCAKLGRDDNGDALMALYEREGIDCRALCRSDEALTGLATIMVEADGSNRIVVYPGANMTLTEGDIDRALDTAPDALYLQLEISHAAVLYAAKEAAARGIPVFIDAGPADATFALEELPPLAVFSPNETEAEIFTGICPDSEDACLACAEALTKRIKSAYIVLKLGGRGAYLYGTAQKAGEILPSYPVKAVDTTAAGDAFTAALTLHYLQTGDMTAAVRYANAVGALTVSRAGASSSLPTKEEVESFLK